MIESPDGFPIILLLQSETFAAELELAGKDEAIRHRRAVRPWGYFESIASEVGYQKDCSCRGRRCLFSITISEQNTGLSSGEQQASLAMKEQSSSKLMKALTFLRDQFTAWRTREMSCWS
jgi:hypothetical protein